MKKLLFCLFGAFILSTSASAQVLVPLTICIEEDYPLGPGNPKTPMVVPKVYIDDYTLTFSADHPEYVLTIKDEESEVVYTTVVSSSETQATLPSTLSGSYQITLAMGNWLFTGWIEL